MFKRYLPVLLLLSGCAGPNNDLRIEGVDPDSVGTMRLDIRNISESDLANLSDRQLGSISAEISRRFRDAGYPVIDKSSEQFGAEPIPSIPNSVNTHVSHVLNVSVGASTLTDTPSGLSFSFGGSNPRSKDFQKALTVPVSCALNSLVDSSQSVSLTERKTAAGEMDTIGLDQSQKLETLRRFFIENIGSTCHNLLSKLGVYPVNPATLEATNRLSRSVRIETEYETTLPNKQTDRVTSSPTAIESATVNRDTKPDASGGSTRATSTHQATEASSKLSNVKNDSDRKVGGQKLAKPSVSTIQNQAKDWRNKNITIFNQANTVILKFGNDQR